jgi:hypothetical protein
MNCGSHSACGAHRALPASPCPRVSTELRATACRRSAGARSCPTRRGTSSSGAGTRSSPKECRPGLYGSYGAFKVGRADASCVACRGFPQSRTLVPWPCWTMPRRDSWRGLQTPWTCAAWLSGVHRPWSCHAPLITAPLPEPHPWTRSSCVLLVRSLTGGTGPARTHGAPSLSARVGLGLPPWPRVAG